jgi:hypothetical protein
MGNSGKGHMANELAPALRTITTQFGDVTLLKPPAELLQSIRSFLPFGFIHNDPPERGVDFGLVMRCGDMELMGVRQQPEDAPYEQCLLLQEDNNILVAHAMAGYLKAGFSGLLLPCTYLTPKKRQMFQSGFAYFGCPSPQGREFLEHPFGSTFDGQFGHGFTVMLTEFMRALHHSSAATGLPLLPPVSLNVRYRGQLGYLEFGFMLVGSQVVCLKTHINPKRDLAWTALRETGITRVFHLPCQPAVIEEAQLSLAKPGASMSASSD